MGVVAAAQAVMQECVTVLLTQEALVALVPVAEVVVAVDHLMAQEVLVGLGQGVAAADGVVQVERPSAEEVGYLRVLPPLAVVVVRMVLLLAAGMADLGRAVAATHV